MPNVAFCHPDYSTLLPKWKLIHAFVSGPTAVRGLREDILPKPNPDDKSAENGTRYEQYLERAVFYPVTYRTLEGYNGQVFSDPPVIRLPSSIADMEMDIDGGGVSITQQASKALKYVIAFGRCALLADFPQTDGQVTREEMQKGDIRPTVTLLQPFDVINWRTEVYGGKIKLTKVVISERYVTGDDGFEQQVDNSWRVILLDEAGGVVVQLWRQSVDEAGKKIPGQFELMKDTSGKEMTYKPIANGERLTEIPLIFLGADNNDPTCDLPPLDGLVELNKGHFRNSADYEESAFQTGQPTYWMSGITEDHLKLMGGSVHVGSRTIIPLPEGGEMGIAQAKPNTIAFEAMTHKEKQMVAVGAKLIEMSKVAMTATEVQLHDGASTCALARMANNVSQGYQWILRRALQFVESGDFKTADVEVRLSTDFRTNDLSPSDQAQLVANWQAGAITDSEMRDQFKRGSMTSATDEEWQKFYKEHQAKQEAAAAAGAAAKKMTQPAKDTAKS